VGNLTVEAWIKTTSLAGQFAVTKYSNSLFSESGFEFGTNQGRAAIYGRAGVGQYLTSGLSNRMVNDGQWHHIVGQVEQNTWRVFVDGVLENSTTYSYSGGDLRTPEHLTIGTYTYLNYLYFDGEIDEVRVWRTARSAADIQANMCRKFATAPADLVAYYRFDQGSGMTAVDQGSQPTNGTLQNFSGNPWHLSGAPLGDASVVSYQTTWAASTKLALASVAGDSAVVSGLPTQTRGVQLYTVNSSPSIAAATGAATSYFGVFTTNSAALALPYSLRLHPLGGASCRAGQQRGANDQAWSSLPTSVSGASLVASALSYRGEYILTGATPPPLTISGDTAVCASSTGQLTAAAAGATAFRWSTGATTPTISGLAPGAYTITATFAGGCQSSAQATIRQGRSPVVAIRGDSVLCPNATAQLTASVANATSGVSYRWNTGATTASISITQGGTYLVTVTSAAGCQQPASYRVRAATALPSFTLGADTTLCEGDRVVLRAPLGTGLRYQWSDGSTGSQLVASTAGTYSLRVSNACSSGQATRVVSARNCLKIPNVVTPNNDAHNDLFVVEGLRGDDWSLDVFNRWGGSVLHTASYHNDWGPTAAPGIYYVLLRRASTGYSYRGWVEVIR